MTDTHFLAEFQKWTGEIDALAARVPRAGMRSLAEGMRLWQWTLEQLRQQVDARGVRLFCDARQGVTFAMAEALCRLLAARSLALDVLEMDRNPQGSEFAALFGDLSTLSAGRAAAQASQTCADLFGGYGERFPISAAARGAFERREQVSAPACKARWMRANGLRSFCAQRRPQILTFHAPSLRLFLGARVGNLSESDQAPKLHTEIHAKQIQLGPEVPFCRSIGR